MGAPLFNALHFGRNSHFRWSTLVEVSLYGFDYDDSPMPALRGKNPLSYEVPCRLLLCGSYGLSGLLLVADNNPGGVYSDVLGLKRQSHGPNILLESRGVPYRGSDRGYGKQFHCIKEGSLVCVNVGQNQDQDKDIAELAMLNILENGEKPID